MRTAVVLAVLAVAAACGSGQDPAVDVPQTAPSTTPPTRGERVECPPAGSEAPATADDLVVGVAFSPDPLRSGQAVTWTVTVTNRGPDRVVLTFPSGQRGDVSLGRDAGTVYQWSADRAFTQVFGCEPLDAGATATYELEGTLTAPPGDYRLTATVAADPAPSPATQAVTVE